MTQNGYHSSASPTKPHSGSEKGLCHPMVYISHTGRNNEDSHSEDNLNCGGEAQEVSEEKNLMYGLKIVPVILVKNVAAFCPCPKSLLEYKL